MKSNLFFAMYQPKAWKIEKIQEAGDFARATLLMTVGNLIQAKKNPSKIVHYTLVRVSDNWYLTGFKEEGSSLSKEKTKEQDQNKKTSAVLSGFKPKEVLSTYLEALEAVFRDKGNDAGQNPAMHFQKAVISTKYFWQKGPQTNRAASRSASLFVTMQPTSWNIETITITDKEAVGLVSIIPQNQAMANLVSNGVHYKLIYEKDSWLLTDYSPSGFSK